jgi:hypothetical protein
MIALFFAWPTKNICLTMANLRTGPPAFLTRPKNESVLLN